MADKLLDDSLIDSDVCIRCAHCCKSTSSVQYAHPNAKEWIDVLHDTPNLEVQWHNPEMTEQVKSDGSKVKRISFGNGLYGTPVWSPRGDLIAFTKLHKGKFYIGVMRTDGSGERLLTENYYQEAPSWSPNGRVLIFYRETKTNSKGEGFSAKLWSIDLTGYNERQIKTPTDASDPSWSSLLSN